MSPSAWWNGRSVRIRLALKPKRSHPLFLLLSRRPSYRLLLLVLTFDLVSFYPSLTLSHHVDDLNYLDHLDFNIDLS